MIKRDDALDLLQQYIKNEKMLYHCLSSEAVLRALAKRLGRDEEKWAMAGLLITFRTLGCIFTGPASMNMLSSRSIHHTHRLIRLYNLKDSHGFT